MRSSASQGRGLAHHAADFGGPAQTSAAMEGLGHGSTSMRQCRGCVWGGRRRSSPAGGIAGKTGARKSLRPDAVGGRARGLPMRRPHSAKRHKGKAAGHHCDCRHARRVGKAVNGGVYGCSQRVEGKEGTGPPAECPRGIPWPATKPPGRTRRLSRQICLLAVIGLPAGLLAGAGLGGIRPAGRAAGALPAGGTAQQRHRERGGPYFAGMASAGQEGQGYGERRPIHGPAFSGRRLGGLFVRSSVGLMSSRCRTADEASMY